MTVDPPKFNRNALIKICERRMKEIQKKQSHRVKNNKGEHHFTSEKEQLEDDLTNILGKVPRLYGEMPELGGYQRISPNEKSYEAFKRARDRMFLKPP